MSKKIKTIERVSDRLRKAVNDSDWSRYEICKRGGIDQAAMSRFMHGGGLNLENVDRLCPVLGLRLEVESGNKPAKPSKKQTTNRKDAK